MKLTPFWEKASKAMQNYYRSQRYYCVVCMKPATVMHHHLTWARSVALRFEGKNLVPLCAQHHCAFHNGCFKTKVAIEKTMRGKYGESWEDDLLKIDQEYIPKTAAQTRDYLKDKEAEYKKLISP